MVPFLDRINCVDHADICFEENSSFFFLFLVEKSSFYFEHVCFSILNAIFLKLFF
jgi:uncharacterized protein YrrD